MPSPSQPAAPVASRAWFSAPINAFLNAQPTAVLGELAERSGFDIATTQRQAWLEQIRFLQTSLSDLDGFLLLEFNIPRMGRRIDVVLLIGPVVFVVEFKIGEQRFDRAALEQVWDYALDLKNFHEASHTLSLVPILLLTGASAGADPQLHADADAVYRPVQVDPDGFRPALDAALKRIPGAAIDHVGWTSASYKPTPTIIEAARALYAQHSVESIARYDAGAKNLRLTSRRIEELVDEACRNKRKRICFVTGVPGAGKTLVGLNVATQRRDERIASHAVFLSGNGPLVAVLREALTRDEVARRKATGEKVKKGRVGESVKAFIQNVHHFRDDLLADPKPPPEHVVIFDEAQRAWNLRQTTNFMRRKKGVPDFAQTEPEFLISCMDRHHDWAVVICLVGGGQEINTGEAGIGAWLDAAMHRFADWELYISSKLTDSEYAADTALVAAQRRPGAHLDDSLHLAVPMRSFRSEHVSTFVKALLDCERDQARAAFANLTRFPILLTRNLDAAKNWVRSRARGTERYGLMASSKAQRLKPHAIDVRVDVDPIHWFLNEREDTRSSYYLEDAATEFQVQGLELDWTCVTWDGDLRFNGSGWSFHDFQGDRWRNIKNADNRGYLRNAYRVLLTRARQGMVIFVPPGDRNDPTRLPGYYDATFDYLRAVGIPELS